MQENRHARALKDLWQGLQSLRFAATLGWIDIKLRYRGSFLGPFWLVLSSLAMVASMGVVYSRLFHLSVRDYLPYLSVSLALWQAGLSALFQESCDCFVESRAMIHAMKLPLSLHAWRLIVRVSIIFSYSIIVPVGVFILYGVRPGTGALLALPGLLLWIIDGLAACLILGVVCARFRDIPPIIGALLQIAFYVTPIIWQPAQLGSRSVYLVLNPFYDVLEIVRGPLLGQTPSCMVVVIACSISALWCGVGFIVFANHRERLAFWV